MRPVYVVAGSENAAFRAAMEASSSGATLPPDLALEDGERVVKQGRAAVITRLLAQHAELVLTNRRLIFLPLSMPFTPVTGAEVDLRLTDVSQMTGGSFWARLRPGQLLGCPEARLHLRDGEVIRFRTWPLQPWIEAIEAQRL